MRNPVFQWWTLPEAVEVCTRLEEIAPSCRCHVALTGGCLYKTGPRKDLDVVFYSIRQTLGINEGMLAVKVHRLGFIVVRKFNFVWKMTYQGKEVDFLFPENEGGDY